MKENFDVASIDNMIIRLNSKTISNFSMVKNELGRMRIKWSINESGIFLKKTNETEKNKTKKRRKIGGTRVLPFSPKHGGFTQ